VLWFRVDVSGAAVHVQAAGAGSNAIEKSFPLIQALRGLEEEMNSEERPAPYRDVDHPLNLNIGVINGGDWPSTVPAETSFHGRLSFFPGTDASAVKERIRRTVAAAAAGDPWLGKNPPRVEFYGFRSEGHVVDRGLPALQTLSGCRRDLAGAPAAEYVSTCTTDLRAFVFFGRGQATCYGPAAVNIHGADESVDLESVLHTARAYALFLARWCELTE
jgi:acetylornithine deacetylase